MSFYGILFAVFFLDQLTKQIILHTILPHGSIDLISGFLSLSVVTNDRGAFGFLSLNRYIFIAVSSIIIALMVWYYQSVLIRKQINVFFCISLGMVAGGAMGNLLDRILYGYVVDFIDVHIGTTFRWPVFNIADIGITIGLVIMILKTFMEKHVNQTEKIKSNA